MVGFKTGIQLRDLSKPSIVIYHFYLHMVVSSTLSSLLPCKSHTPSAHNKCNGMHCFSSRYIIFVKELDLVIVIVVQLCGVI